MDTLETLTQQVMGGHKVTKEEALWLSTQPLEPLCRQADMIRRHFCKNTFDPVSYTHLDVYKRQL